MEKLDDNKKIILLILLISITIVMLFVTAFMLFKDVNKSETEDAKDLYGTVVSVDDDYITIEDMDGNTYEIKTDDNIAEGDLVLFDTTGSDIEVIANVDDLVKTTTTTTTTTTTRVTTTTRPITTTTTTKVNKVSDQEVIDYVSNEYSLVSTYSDEPSFKDKAKEKFITIVDFIFYDVEIKGKKFSELTSTAKAKVIYYTILLDNKIDNKWPNYKENLGNKYTDIKAKLIAKYLDLTTSICENNKENCENVKSDFNLMKKSVGITWDIVKGAFSYAYNTGKNKLVTWYEIFSGK